MPARHSIVFGRNKISKIEFDIKDDLAERTKRAVDDAEKAFTDQKIEMRALLSLQASVYAQSTRVHIHMFAFYRSEKQRIAIDLAALFPESEEYRKFYLDNNIRPQFPPPNTDAELVERFVAICSDYVLKYKQEYHNQVFDPRNHLLVNEGTTLPQFDTYSEDDEYSLVTADKSSSKSNQDNFMTHEARLNYTDQIKNYVKNSKTPDFFSVLPGSVVKVTQSLENNQQAEAIFFATNAIIEYRNICFRYMYDLKKQSLKLFKRSFPNISVYMSLIIYNWFNIAQDRLDVFSMNVVMKLMDNHNPENLKNILESFKTNSVEILKSDILVAFQDAIRGLMPVVDQVNQLVGNSFKPIATPDHPVRNPDHPRIFSPKPIRATGDHEPILSLPPAAEPATPSASGTSSIIAQQNPQLATTVDPTARLAATQQLAFAQPLETQPLRIGSH